VDALVSFVVAALILRSPRVSYEAMLLGGYLALAQIAVAQWLAGGLEAPYWQLLILPADRGSRRRGRPRAPDYEALPTR